MTDSFNDDISKNKQSKSVLMIDNFLPGARYTAELCDELCKRVNLTLLAKDNCEVDAASVSYRLIPALYGKKTASKIKNISAFLRGLFITRREILSKKYNVIHVQLFKSEKIEMPLVEKWANRAKLPVVYTVHNIDPHESDPKGHDCRQRWYKACSGLITHNQTSLDVLNERYDVDGIPCKVIVPGLYPYILKVDKAAPIKREKGATNFLAFGMIRRYKGTDILIKALSCLDAETRKHVRVIVAGKQYQNQLDIDFEKMAKDLGVDDIVEFRLRRIPDEEVRSLYEWADFAMFPYRELYGTGALLMTYTLGTPIIASELPTFIEESDGGKTGILFETENEGSLAKAITAATKTTEEERMQYRSAIEDLIERRYNWTLVANKTARFYEEVRG